PVDRRALRNVADAVAYLEGRPTQHEGFAVVAVVEAEQHLEQCALPCPVGADDRAEHTRRHAQRDVLQRALAAVADGHAAGLDRQRRLAHQRASHSASAAGSGGTWPPRALTMAVTLWTIMPTYVPSLVPPAP